MTHDELKAWLDAYQRAWETRDADAAANIFADDATYQETPFVEPLLGRAEILAYWTHIARSQEEIRFGYEMLAVTDQHGLAHWWAAFARVPDQSRVKLDGVFLITLNAAGRCTALREWWQKKTIARDQTGELSPGGSGATPLRLELPET